MDTQAKEGFAVRKEEGQTCSSTLCHTPLFLFPTSLSTSDSSHGVKTLPQDELFRVLKKAQHTLLRVEPELLDGRLPLQDEAALDALVRLWENTAFFGDLILRLPDIVHSQYDGHAVRTDLLRYALDLSLQSPVFAEDSPHRAQLLLVMQETGMAETPDPAYTNPFREDNVRRQVHAARERQVKLDREAAKREKRQALRQPRLRGAHQEL